MTAVGPTEKLFAYGSLLDPALRRRLLGRTVTTLPARLSGFERRRARHCYLVKRRGGAVEGLVLANLDGCELERLDAYEEVPRLYRRRRCKVVAPGARRAIPCWVYLAVPALLAALARKRGPRPTKAPAGPPLGRRQVSSGLAGKPAPDASRSPGETGGRAEPRARFGAGHVRVRP